MNKFRMQHIPKMAGGAINLDIASIFNRFFASIVQFFQRTFGTRTIG